jgi:hypothetical protein
VAAIGEQAGPVTVIDGVVVGFATVQPDAQPTLVTPPPIEQPLHVSLPAASTRSGDVTVLIPFCGTVTVCARATDAPSSPNSMKKITPVTPMQRLAAARRKSFVWNRSIFAVTPP